MYSHSVQPGDTLTEITSGCDNFILVESLCCFKFHLAVQIARTASSYRLYMPYVSIASQMLFFNNILEYQLFQFLQPRHNSIWSATLGIY